MQNFQLHIGPLFQGQFEPKEINLAFVFQVNCPGCFIYGIPVMNVLSEKYSNKIGIIGISTCFEDFDKNTPENTIRLLQNKELVGATKKHFAQDQIDTYPHPINFAIAFDETITQRAFLTNENIESICRTNPDYESWTSQEQDMLREKIIRYYTQFEFFGKTFTLNQLRGTPSFIVFDRNMVVIKSLFGYQSAEILSQIIEA